MKYVRIVGLAAVSAIAMMAFAGTASATVATSPEGTVYTGTIKAEEEGGHVNLIGPLGLDLQCSFEGEGQLNSHGASSTAKGPITAIAFNGCTNGYSVKTLAGGELEVHTEGGSSNGNGLLTSHNAEFEVKVPMGTICIYKTNNTSIGTLTGSKNTGGHATADIVGTVPRVAGSALCGASGSIKASYTVTTPSTLSID